MHNEQSTKAKYLVIVDYNLARVYDVQLMAKYALNRYGLEIILIRPNPTGADKGMARRVIDLDPRATDFLAKAVAELQPIKNEIAAILPFSDNAVQSGAALAEALEKIGDSAQLADAAYSKLKYRLREQEIKTYLDHQSLFIPKFKRIYSVSDLQEFAEKCPQGFVLKPSCEGNNRGVIRIYPGESLDHFFDEVKLYEAEGLICEELIPFTDEYSFDGIGHLNFVTKKESISSRYPVENGQVVSGDLPPEVINSVVGAGRLANLIVGQKLGPFHNEIKFDPVTGGAAVVEPNRRPAGMKIWHLAEKVYGVNFFELWIDQMVTGILPKRLPDGKGSAAIRQFASPYDGEIISDLSSSETQKIIFARILDRMNGETLSWSGFQISAKPGQKVLGNPKDNSGFIGEVSLYIAQDSESIVTVLNKFERAWKSVLVDFIRPINTHGVAI